MDTLHRFGGRTPWLLVLPIIIMGAPAVVRPASEPGGVLWIENGQALACPAIKGAYVGFLIPDRGTLYVSLQRFPGSRRVGQLEKDQLVLEVADRGRVTLKTKLFFPEPRPVWGLLDRTLAIGTRKGCIAFPERRFSELDDFRTYAHWILRNLFFALQPETAERGLALQVGSRRIALEIEVQGYQPVTPEIREGSPYRLRVPDPNMVLVFLPVALDAETGQVAVICQRAVPREDGGEALEKLGVVMADTENPGVLRNDVQVTIRVHTVR